MACRFNYFPQVIFGTLSDTAPKGLSITYTAIPTRNRGTLPLSIQKYYNAPSIHEVQNIQTMTPPTVLRWVAVFADYALREMDIVLANPSSCRHPSSKLSMTK